MTEHLIADIPGSKSLTNRALFTAAAAPGTSLLRRPLHSDDTIAFARGLQAMGYTVDTSDSAVWRVHGSAAGPVADQTVVDCVDAGTAARFLPALAAVGRGRFRFDGSSQLRARPLGPLLDSLTALGASITGEGLPCEIVSDGLRGGDIEVDGGRSSQYLSGVLLAGPLMRAPLRVRARSLVSSPYIAMTISLMRAFGVEVAEEDDGWLAVPTGPYRATDYSVEPDASTASYFFAAAALTGATLTVPGLGSASSQGDLAFVDVLAKMGAHVECTPDRTTVRGPATLSGGVDVDMGDISDTFMTLAAIAPFADAPVRIHGIAHARLKESDRIAAVAGNLERCGITVEQGPDWIRVHPGVPQPFTVDCHRDHRIAMSFSVLGLRAPGIELDDRSCVGKTFPGFHAEFGRLFGKGRR